MCPLAKEQSPMLPQWSEKLRIYRGANKAQRTKQSPITVDGIKCTKRIIKVKGVTNLTAVHRRK